MYMYVYVVLPYIQDIQFSERWAEEADMVFDRATSGPLKNHVLLHFAHADFQEVCEHNAQVL